VAAAGHADDVIDLDFATGADAEIALDTGVKIDGHRRMAAVGRERGTARKTALFDPHAGSNPPKLRIRIVGVGLIRLIGQ